MKLLIKCINVCNEGCDWFKHTTFDSYAYTDAECTHPKGKGVDVWTNRNKVPINCPLPDSRSPLPDSPVEISRKEAKEMAKALNEYAPNFEHVFVDGFMACFDQIKATDKWIPVSERKPKLNTRCLIVERGENIQICNYCKSFWNYPKNSIGFLDEQDEQPSMCNPTHWRPLPDPPKEG